MGRLLAVLFGLTLPLLVAELLFRLAGSSVAAPRLPLTYDLAALDQLAAGQAYIQFDAELGWLPTPNVERARGDTRYRHNADGLRSDRAYSPAPDPGVRRFAAYGDSFTYCEEISISRCWTRLLEEELPNSEVLNFGVPGYAPDQAWLRYQRDSSGWRSCAVLIGHLTENVNRVVNRFRPFYEPKTGITLGKPRYILEGQTPALLPNPARRPEDFADPVWVESNLGPRDAWYFPGTFVANPFDRLQLVSLARTARYQKERDGVEWTPDWAQRSYQPGSEPFEVATSVLSGFAEHVRSNGATPVVLVFPMRSEVEGQRDRVPKPHAPLLDELQRRGIAVLDLTDALGQEARRVDISRLFEGHYTPQANALIARTLAAQLPGLTAATCGS